MMDHSIENYLKSLPRFHRTPGLSRIERFIADNKAQPDAYTVIIGGTNGKGSVGALVENILLKAGVSVGTMKSPHVYDVGERITFEGKNIEYPVFRETLDFVRSYFEAQKEEPIFADVLTAAALYHFTHTVRPDVLILEIGIGGDLDPANAVRRNLSVITNIGHDHADILGRYPEEIARKKAGIIREGVPLITGEKNPEALGVFLEVCSSVNAPFIAAADGHLHSIGYDGTDVSYNGDRYTIGIPGFHQVENAGIVREIIDQLRKTCTITPPMVYEGMKQTRLPWRMELFSNSPTVMFDGAHNRESWLNMRETLACLPFRELHVVLFVQQSKHLEDFPLSLPGTRVTIHLPDIKERRFYPPRKIRNAFNNFEGRIVMYSNLDEALQTALRGAGNEDLILCTGSFQLANTIKQAVARLTPRCR